MSKKIVPVSLQSETVEKSDLEYLSNVLAQRQAAELVVNNFTSFLAQKYKLGKGDEISDGGVIKRAEKDEEQD